MITSGKGDQSMKVLREVSLLAVSCIALVGCQHGAKRYKPPPLASVSEVLNEVKEEFRVYAATKPLAVGVNDECNTAPHNLNLVPSKVTVKLKTAVTRQNEPTAGLTAPIGVLSIDPSFSGNYSRVQTQQLDIPLAVNLQQMKPLSADINEHQMAKAMAQLRDELIKTNHAPPCFEPKDDMTLSIGFQVVNKSTGGISLKLLIFKFGNKTTYIEDTTQVIEMKMKLEGGNLMYGPD